MRRASSLIQRALSSGRGEPAYEPVSSDQNAADGSSGAGGSRPRFAARASPLLTAASLRFSPYVAVKESEEADAAEYRHVRTTSLGDNHLAGGDTGAPSRSFVTPGGAAASTPVQRRPTPPPPQPREDLEAFSTPQKQQRRPGALSVDSAAASGFGGSGDSSSSSLTLTALLAATRRRRRLALIAGFVFVVSVGVALGLAALIGWSEADWDPDYRAWKKQHSVDYGSRRENTRRYEIFVTTKAQVDALNSAPDTTATFEVRLSPHRGARCGARPVCRAVVAPVKNGPPDAPLNTTLPPPHNNSSTSSRRTTPRLIHVLATRFLVHMKR